MFSAKIESEIFQVKGVLFILKQEMGKPTLMMIKTHAHLGRRVHFGNKTFQY